jgi:hypothetical protein
MVGSLSSDSDNQSNYSTIHSMEGIRDNDTGNSYPGRFPVSSKSIVNSDPPESFVRVRNSSLQLESNDAEDIMEELRAFSPNRLSRTRRRQLSQFGLDDSEFINFKLHLSFLFIFTSFSRPEFWNVQIFPSDSAIEAAWAVVLPLQTLVAWASPPLIGINMALQSFFPVLILLIILRRKCHF